ncbi:MAG: Ig domain-containing protein [Gemmatimonadaceae bacterium]|nr:Ig domain-containing protein [Gemmatimonadaceae bacterium]
MSFIRKELGAIMIGAAVARRPFQLVAAVGFLWAAACTTDVAPVAIASVAINIASDSILPGRTLQASVLVKDASGIELSGRKATWESAFPNIATVSATGLVTPVATGVTQIRATVEGRTAAVNIKVLEKVTRVVITPQNDNVAIGQTRQLTVTVTGANGASISGRVVRYQSSNPSVAIVSAQGVVSGVSKGTTTILADAELDQVNGTATITVIDVPVSSVTIAPVGAQIMRLGNFLQATATTRDASNNVLQGRTVTWTASNPAVATVTQSGLITAIALGSTTITAESEGRTASMPVTVTEVPPKSVTLTPDTVSLGTGTTRQLTPTVIDSLNRVVNSLATRSVLWTSSNPAVATVSNTGVVSALTAGTARVNVTVDNVRSNDVVFVVTDQVNSIRLTPAQTPPMRVGNTLQVTAQALNNQNQPLPGKTFTWTSSNPSVATVSSSGLVTANAVGSVTITAETENRTASLNIQVTLVPIGTVTIVPSQDTLINGDQKQYNPVVTDSAGRPVTSLLGRSVVWTSNNIPVAGVASPQGIVTASNAQTGIAQITVTIDGVTSNTLTVRVAQVATIQVSPNPATVQVTKTVTLAVTLKDAQGNTLNTSRTINFTPTGPNAGNITASPAGVITGVTAGTSQVTVTVSGVIGVATVVPVTVNP